MDMNSDSFRQILKCLLSLENENRTKAEVSFVTPPLWWREIFAISPLIFFRQEAFNNIPTETRVLYLLNSITDKNLDESEKQLACVLLRRLITNDFPEFYPKVREKLLEKSRSLITVNLTSTFACFQLSLDDQVQLKECLLLLIQTETNDALKKRMCDIVSELARNLVDEDGQNNWPEFLQFLFRCASSDSPQLKECSLRMFA
jgi:hypothetical protein